MPRKLPSGFADVYATVAQTLLKELGDSLAVEAGPPASVEVVPITDPGRARAWNEPHPEATDQAMRELADQRLAEHLASGMDDAKARKAVEEDLTHFRYRKRMEQYTAGTVSWTEQVKEATRLSRVASRHPVPPAPLPPAQLPGLPPTPAVAMPMPPGGQPGGQSGIPMSPRPMPASPEVSPGVSPEVSPGLSAPPPGMPPGMPPMPLGG